MLFGDARWQALPSASDLSLARGRIAGREVMLLATDPQRAKGTFGPAECAAAAEALGQARVARQPMLLLIDSAGARLDTGLAIQGALRVLLREALDARLDGLPMLAMLGHHVFGGASLLAFVTQRRCYSGQTLLAMSGPRLLRGPDGGELPHAEALTAISATARCAHGGAERPLADEGAAWALAAAEWAGAAAAPGNAGPELKAERELLRRRLGSSAADDIVQLRGATLSLRTNQALGAGGAIALAELAERSAREQPGRSLLLEVDCPGHSLALADEGLLLSHYLAHLALSLRSLVRNGTTIRLRLLGEISGGVYAALAAAVSSIELGRGALVRTLPSISLAHLFKDRDTSQADPSQYLRLGVVDAICESDVGKVSPK